MRQTPQAWTFSSSWPGGPARGRSTARTELDTLELDRPHTQRMTRRLVVVFVLALCAPAAAQDTVTFRTVARDDGAAEPESRRIEFTFTAQARWSTFWKRLEPTTKRPRVDFSKQHADRGHAGPRRRAAGTRSGSRRSTAPTTAGSSTCSRRIPGKAAPSTQQITRPYHVVRVPRTGEDVSFERRRDRSARLLRLDAQAVASSAARLAASVRVRQLSLARMLRTCMSTVRGLRNSSRAISRFVRPTDDAAASPRARGGDRPAPSCAAAARRPRRRSSGSPSRGELVRGGAAASGREPSRRAAR